MIENYPDYIFEEAERREMENKSISEKIVESTLPYTLRPKSGDREKVIAIAFKVLINRCGYTHLYLDGDHGLGVVNVRDIVKIIEELEKIGTVEEVSSAHRRRDLDSL